MLSILQRALKTKPKESEITVVTVRCFPKIAARSSAGMRPLETWLAVP